MYTYNVCTYIDFIGTYFKFCLVHIYIYIYMIEQDVFNTYTPTGIIDIFDTYMVLLFFKSPRIYTYIYIYTYYIDIFNASLSIYIYIYV